MTFYVLLVSRWGGSSFSDERGGPKKVKFVLFNDATGTH